MFIECGGNDIEASESRSVHLVIPFGQSQPGSVLGGVFGKYHSQGMREGIGLSNVRILGEEYFRPFLLLLRPIVARLVKEVSAARQQLLFRISVGKDQRLVFFAPPFGVLHRVRLFLNGIPSVLYTYLLYGVASQLLYVEAVYYSDCRRETGTYDLVHGFLHFHRHLLHLLSFF